MQECCAHDNGTAVKTTEKPAADNLPAGRQGKECCGACPDANCDGCACSKQEKAAPTFGCCMGSGCGCNG